MAEPTIIVIAGRGPRKSVRMRRDVFTIGSADDVDLTIDDGFIARHHADIRRRRDNSFVIARLAINPVYVDNQEVVGERPLADGSTIRLSPNSAIRFNSGIRKPKQTASRTTEASDAESLGGRLSSLAPVLLPIYGIVAVVAIVLALRAPSEPEKFEATEIAAKEATSEPAINTSCHAAWGQSTDPKSMIGSFQNSVLFGVDAERRADWREALRYYDNALTIQSDASCRGVRYAAVRREYVRQKLANVQ